MTPKSDLFSVPNLLTFVRGLGVPFFIALGLSADHDYLALAILAVGGATDYFDGKLARAWGQTSRFGELADPAIDRLYIVAVLIVLMIREAIPTWVVVLLIGRDLILGLLTLRMNARGIPPLKVTYIGKAATFNLLYAFPFLLLALQTWWLGDVAFVLGWSFAVWGIALYLFTGFTYLREGIRSLRSPIIVINE